MQNAFFSLHQINQHVIASIKEGHCTWLLTPLVDHDELMKKKQKSPGYV